MNQDQEEKREDREQLLRSIRWELSQEDEDEQKEAWTSYWFEWLNEE